MIFPHKTLWVGRVHDCSQMCTLNHVAQHDCKFPKQVCAAYWLTHAATIYQKRGLSVASDRVLQGFGGGPNFWAKKN